MSFARALAPLVGSLLVLACAASGPDAPSPAEPPELPASHEVYPGDDGRVFSPERAVQCDRATQICYSGGAPSAAATERYLGEDAANRLLKQLPR